MIPVMPDVSLSEYHVNLRTALGDQGAAGVYEWKDEPLSAALRSVVQMGVGPAGVELNVAETGFTVAPATPDARGFLVFQAALLLVGGNRPFSWKSRGMAVQVRAEERAETITHLRRMIQRLETDGDPHGEGGNACFAVWRDFENAIGRTGDVKQVH